VIFILYSFFSLNLSSLVILFVFLILLLLTICSGLTNAEITSLPPTIFRNMSRLDTLFDRWPLSENLNAAFISFTRYQWLRRHAWDWMYFMPFADHSIGSWTARRSHTWPPVSLRPTSVFATCMPVQSQNSLRRPCFMCLGTGSIAVRPMRCVVEHWWLGALLLLRSCADTFRISCSSPLHRTPSPCLHRGWQSSLGSVYLPSKLISRLVSRADPILDACVTVRL
jgi:hypothetical protein